MSWEGARNVCKNIGLGYDLAVIGDVDENQFVAEQINGNEDFSNENGFWIGLKKEQNTTTYEWVDGSDLKYEKWDQNNPNKV